MVFMDPLEQFSIELFCSYFDTLGIRPYTNITTAAFYIWVSIVLAWYGFFNIHIFNKFQEIIGLFFMYIIELFMNIVNLKNCSFGILVYSIFLFILFSNLLGLIPYSLFGIWFLQVCCWWKSICWTLKQLILLNHLS